jgi:hypothetical protein
MRPKPVQPTGVYKIHHKVHLGLRLHSERRKRKLTMMTRPRAVECPSLFHRGKVSVLSTIISTNREIMIAMSRGVMPTEVAAPIKKTPIIQASPAWKGLLVITETIKPMVLTMEREMALA